MNELTVWTYGGAQFELDLQDVAVMERYETAFARLQEEEGQAAAMSKASEALRAYCGLYVRLFDTLFGEGAARSLLGDGTNARVCEEAYISFLDFVQAQMEDGRKRREALTAKYAPSRVRRGK